MINEIIMGSWGFMILMINGILKWDINHNDNWIQRDNYDEHQMGLPWRHGCSPKWLVYSGQYWKILFNMDDLGISH